MKYFRSCILIYINGQTDKCVNHAGLTQFSPDKIRTHTGHERTIKLKRYNFKINKTNKKIPGTVEQNLQKRRFRVRVKRFFIKLLSY